MTSSTLCALLALAAYPAEGPADGAGGSVYTLSQPFETTVRAQSPYYGPAQYGQDPFLNPGSPAQPGGDAWWLREPQPLVSGLNGPQPYRFGWSSSLDATYIPDQPTSGGARGDFGYFALDLAARNSSPVGPGYVFTHGPEAGWRSWNDTPTLSTGEQLPNNVYRLGWDFEVATPSRAPWSFVAGFTPSVNSDFERGLSSDAYHFDGRAAAVYQASPGVQYVLGLQYWDRVDDVFLPWAGVVLTPDQRSEYRLMFPESRLSYYVGNVGGDDKWLYVSGGYHVESFEVELQTPGTPFTPSRGRREEIQFSDWRAVVGLRSENSTLGAFIEGGVVFDREVEFGRGTPGFDIDGGFILRAGLRF